MIDAMVHAIAGTDVKHVVFLSSVGAQHADGTGPVVLLHDAEQELRTLKTPVTFLRPCYFMENWAPALPDAKEGLLNTFLPAETRWAQVAAHDVGQAAAKLILEHPKAHRVVELSGPEDVCPADVARVLAKLLETEVEPLEEPLDQVAEAYTGMGFSPELAQMYQQLYQSIRSGRLAFEHPESLQRGKETLEQALQRNADPALGGPGVGRGEGAPLLGRGCAREQAHQHQRDDGDQERGEDGVALEPSRGQERLAMVLERELLQVPDDGDGGSRRGCTPRRRPRWRGARRMRRARPG